MSQYVIYRVHWNMYLAPEDEPLEGRFSMSWYNYPATSRLLSRRSYGVEIAGLILRFYYGIVGCIIPVGRCIYSSDEDVFAFTLAGPCDADRKKEFYVLVHDIGWWETRLVRSSPGFSSVTDYHLNRIGVEKWVIVAPVEGGVEAAEAEFVKCGYHSPHD
ncbi:hypothetical protein C8J57DRAFT_1501424 [Mycena rebaudengoi]|nr:hypothetical protein C8J57DRAFT_1501424 [Mycena rebaudengoi]